MSTDREKDYVFDQYLVALINARTQNRVDSIMDSVSRDADIDPYRFLRLVRLSKEVRENFEPLPFE